METVTGIAVTTVTIMIVDKREILTIEKIDDSKDNFLANLRSPLTCQSLRVCGSEPDYTRTLEGK